MTPMLQEWLYRVARFEQSGLSLEGFAGKLHSDASGVYHEVQRLEPAIVEVG
jgi:hypothetical protein